RFFLDEELTLPSVATWWCGQPRERQYVLEHLDELVIRRISTSRSLFASGLVGLVTPTMSADERAQLVRDIERNGHDYVGQEPASLSTAPAWAGADALRAAPISLRVYVAATDKGYQVMPGGLARIA